MGRVVRMGRVDGVFVRMQIRIVCRILSLAPVAVPVPVFPVLGVQLSSLSLHTVEFLFGILHLLNIQNIP